MASIERNERTRHVAIEEGNLVRYRNVDNELLIARVMLYGGSTKVELNLHGIMLQDRPILADFFCL